MKLIVLWLVLYLHSTVVGTGIETRRQRKENRPENARRLFPISCLKRCICTILVTGRETNRLSILLLVLQAADVFLFLTDIRKRKKMERNLMSVEQESKRYKLWVFFQFCFPLLVAHPLVNSTESWTGINLWNQHVISKPRNGIYFLIIFSLFGRSWLRNGRKNCQKQDKKQAKDNKFLADSNAVLKDR